MDATNTSAQVSLSWFGLLLNQLQALKTHRLLDYTQVSIMADAQLTFSHLER